MPPPKPRCYELAIQKACKGIGIPVIPSRLSILTRPHAGRAACHYCGQCGRGCATHANFSSTSVLLPPALYFGTTTGQLWMGRDGGEQWECVFDSLPPIHCVKVAVV